MRLCLCTVQQLFDGAARGGGGRARLATGAARLKDHPHNHPRSCSTIESTHSVTNGRKGAAVVTSRLQFRFLVVGNCFHRRGERREMPIGRSRDPSAVMNGADIWNAAKRGDHVAISRLAEQVRKLKRALTLPEL